MAQHTQLWWAFLCAVAALNVCAWVVSAVLLHRRRAQAQADAWPSRALLLLSAGYVLGCAWRSVFPVYDVQRLVLVDSWLSSVLIGRSVATLAELCFAAQWALVLRCLAARSGSAGVHAASQVILPLIVVAELCSWTSVLSTSNLGHVFEESLWGLTAALVGVSLFRAERKRPSEWRPLVAAGCTLAAAYVIYIFCIDVPMYWSRFAADEAQGRPYLTLAQGLVDTATRWTVTHEWARWKSEVVWMSLYFSVAVWLSIALVHVPGLARWAARLRARRHTRAAALPAR